MSDHLVEAAQFLSLLDETADSFSFRVFDDDEARKNPHLAAAFHGPIEEIGGQLAAANQQGAGVFVVINEGGQSAASITRVRAVFADTDGAPLDPIMACELEPHFVVETSPGNFHAYWLVDDLPLDKFADVQRAIARRFGTDPVVNDLPRVMRLPGFDHRKGAPFRVRLFHESGGLPYSAEQILAHFPPVATEATGQAAPLGADVVVDVNRHADVLKCTLLLAQSVRAGAMTRDEAFNTMLQRRDAGRYSRPVDDAEIARALDGAIGKGGAVAVDPAAVEPQLTAVPLGDIMRTQPPAPGFVIHPLVPRRVTTLLGGHGGLGKSMLGLTLCAHVAAGRGWGPYVIEQGLAVYVSLEDEASIVLYRLRNIIDAYELPAAEVLANLRVFDGSDIEAELVQEATAAGVSQLVDTSLMGVVESAVAGATLAMIDNASDAYGANENARRLVRAFVRGRLGKIARRNNAGMVLLAHIDKSSAKHGSRDNSYSGSTAWHNSARSRLALLEDENGALELRQEKLNLGPKAEPLSLQRAEEGVLMPRVAGNNPGASLIAANDADLALVALTAALDKGITVSTASSGPRTAHHDLEPLGALMSPFKGRDGKRRLFAALVHLQDQGRVRRSEYEKPNRHKAFRWELAQIGPEGAP